MIELQQLTFSGIRRFVEEQSVDFTDRDKLIQVDGRNENTGGSSGAGKSTIFLALDYLLGISDVPSTVLQSRLTKDPLTVKGVFLVEGAPLTLTRSKKGGFTVDYNGESVTGNVKLAEERLDEIIGIPRSVFKKMVHKKQKEGGFFIDMTGKQTYEFLTTVLGLDRFTSYLNEIKSNNSEDLKTLDKIEVKLQSDQDTIKDFERMLGDKEKPVQTVTTQDLQALKRELTDVETEKTRLEQECAGKLQSLVVPEQRHLPYTDSKVMSLNAEKQAKLQELEKIESAKENIDAQLAEFPLLRQKAQHIGPQIAELKRQKMELEKALCPTCEQSWVTETAKDKMHEISTQVDSLTTQALDIKNKLDNQESVVSNAKRLQTMYVEAKQKVEYYDEQIQSEQAKEQELHNLQIAKYAEELKEYNKKQSAIRSMYDGDIARQTQLHSEVKLQYNTKNHEYESYKKNLQVYNREISRLAELVQEKTASINDAKKQQIKLKQKINVADETRRLITTYTLQTFQETLDLIGDMATEILSGIPNMSSATIYFEGCKENKDGSLKDEVTGILNLDGESIPIKSLSGGERTAIDLAVDLAVIDVIETRAGKGANFYIIDEPFDGLDSVCRENCLEILKQIDTNKKIIMVDHSTELKEMVGDVVTVVRSGETSTII